MWLPTSLKTARMLRGTRSRVCVAVTQERPRCRAAILRAGLRPWLVDGVWCGLAEIPDGGPVTLSPGMRSQMRRMIAEGVWDR
jgi:hypothetical protein